MLSGAVACVPCGYIAISIINVKQYMLFSQNHALFSQVLSISPSSIFKTLFCAGIMGVDGDPET